MVRPLSLIANFMALAATARAVVDDNVHETCMISPRAIVSDACASYATLEDLNSRVKPALDSLVTETDFFSHYRLNLYNKQCPFWNDESGTCGNRACAVETLDDEADIPEIWRAAELGKLRGPVAKHPGRDQQKERPAHKPLLGGLGDHIGERCVVEYDDECDERDYCVPEDESATSKGDYVSLVQNPERFTGYAGAGARQVWDTIYSENCFQKSSFPHSANLGQPASRGPAAHDFKQVLAAVSRQKVYENGLAPTEETQQAAPAFGDEECLEKRVFYRVVSGMHTSINTHLCWDYFNQTTGEWTRNLDCYTERIHKFPERVSNLYFNYALVSRAIAKLGPYLRGSDYTFCLGDVDGDRVTREKVRAVTEAVASVPAVFDESVMFKNGEGPSLKEDFRHRFRNVSRVMDCVGCDKCRLWGKLQTAGYGTALKVLFEFENDNEIPVLSRTEIVSLFNTYARVSNSMHAISVFREMVEARDMSAKVEEVTSVLEQLDEEALSSVLLQEQMAATKTDEIPSETDVSEYWEEVEYNPLQTGAPPAPPSEEPAEEAPRKEWREVRVRPKHELNKVMDMPDVRKGQRDRSAMGELKLVWELTKYIVRSWFQVPKAIFVIVVSNIVRAWQFFLGVPVAQPAWGWSRDEL